MQWLQILYLEAKTKEQIKFKLNRIKEIIRLEKKLIRKAENNKKNQ